MYKNKNLLVPYQKKQNSCYNKLGDKMIIDQNKHRLKYFIKGISVIMFYFLLSLFKNLPFILLKINIEDIPQKSYNFYSITLEMMMIVIIYYTFEKEIKLAIKDLKENHQEYFQKYFKTYILGVTIMMLSNIIIGKLGGGISENESTIRNEFKLYPIYIYTSAVLLAPFLEEFIFRLGFKSMIKNNVIYIIISGLIFGSLHLLGTKIDYLLPIYLISYCSCGWAFAYMMAKSNNILISTAFHLMHNGLLMSLQFFLLLFT